MNNRITNCERIESAIKEMSNKNNYIEFLLFCKKFYEEVFENQLLIFYQYKDASIIKSYIGWKYVGRKLKKNPSTIYVYKKYKEKEQNQIDGQINLKGKEIKQRKNNKIEILGTEKYERIAKYDISDTIIDRNSQYKYNNLLANEFIFDRQNLYIVLKEIWNRDIVLKSDIEDDISYRLQKTIYNILEKKEINEDKDILDIVIKSIIIIVSNFFNIKFDMVKLNKFDKFLSLSIKDKIILGKFIQKESEKMIETLKKHIQKFKEQSA